MKSLAIISTTALVALAPAWIFGFVEFISGPQVKVVTQVVTVKETATAGAVTIMPSPQAQMLSELFPADTGYQTYNSSTGKPDDCLLDGPEGAKLFIKSGCAGYQTWLNQIPPTNSTPLSIDTSGNMQTR